MNTLEDLRCVLQGYEEDVFFHRDDVKLKLKELQDKRQNCYECGMMVDDDLLEEIFGKELVEAKR